MLSNGGKFKNGLGPKLWGAGGSNFSKTVAGKVTNKFLIMLKIVERSETYSASKDQEYFYLFSCRFELSFGEPF